MFTTPLFSVAQIRTWDAYTIASTPIDSLELMENASIAFVGKFMTLYDASQEIHVLCGLGNNGGDGLAIARLLQAQGYKTKVYIIKYSNKTSVDFQANLQRIENTSPTTVVTTIADLPLLPEKMVFIDALIGSGLTKPLTGFLALIVEWVNEQSKPIVSVDIASGLLADLPTVGKAVIRPTHTISFEIPKLAFLLPENEARVGKFHTVPIGLHATYKQQTSTPYCLLTKEFITHTLKSRPKFGHKGTFGHALLMGGSYGKIGAVVLATRACLRSGAGLTTAYIPAIGYVILQTSVPEAMTITDHEADFITDSPDLKPYKAIGVGIGMDKHPQTQAMLLRLLKQQPQNLVLDADALNILAENKTWLELLPQNTILTPHPKEFERLTRPAQDNVERLEILCNFAQVYGVYVLLKGAHSALATPAGKVYFNMTGNAGMATGGSGDVLTGIITALLAQGYTPLEAAAIGMYIHGFAGDLAVQQQATHTLIATDLITQIGTALMQHIKENI